MKKEIQVSARNIEIKAIKAYYTCIVLGTPTQNGYNVVVLSPKADQSEKRKSVTTNHTFAWGAVWVHFTLLPRGSAGKLSSTDLGQYRYSVWRYPVQYRGSMLCLPRL